MFIRLAVEELSVQYSGGIITCEVGWWEYDKVHQTSSYRSASILLSAGQPAFHFVEQVVGKWLQYRDVLIPVEEVVDYGVGGTIVFAKTKMSAGSHTLPRYTPMGNVAFVEPGIVSDIPI